MQSRERSGEAEGSSDIRLVSVDICFASIETGIAEQ